MIEWSLDALRACESVRAIVVAAPPEVVAESSGGAGGSGGVGESSSRLPDIRQVGPGGGSTTVVAGGATRAGSVANALRLVATEIVAIHDAARPLLTPELVEALVARLDAEPKAAGAIAASPLADTVKVAGDRGTRPTFPVAYEGKVGFVVEETLDRSRLWAAQTPQVFRTAALRAALEVSEEERDAATDEAMLVETAGGTVLIHPVTEPNFKVTTPLDLRLAELLLEEHAGSPSP